MCGRYVSTADAASVAAWFDAAPAEQDLPADYNVAPTKPVFIVADRPGREADDPDVRQVLVARWGLVPSWAKDPSIGSRMINARAETVAQKPAFRRAFARRRCLVPADGYFEWYQPPAGPSTPLGRSGRPLKRPYYIHRGDGGSLALAGLYEWWHDPARSEDDQDSWLLTCTVITTDADDELARIHDRMPMLVAAKDWPRWLDRSLDAEGAADLLHPGSAADLVAQEVSTLVNAVGNNGPELIAPLPTTE